jgi:hypothetical protein
VRGYQRFGGTRSEDGTVVYPSETVVSAYTSTRRCDVEDQHRNLQLRDNLKFLRNATTVRHSSEDYSQHNHRRENLESRRLKRNRKGWSRPTHSFQMLSTRRYSPH